MRMFFLFFFDLVKSQRLQKKWIIITETRKTNNNQRTTKPRGNTGEITAGRQQNPQGKKKTFVQPLVMASRNRA